MTAITVKSRKAKARALQNMVVEDLVCVVPELNGEVRPAIMGESGTDIKLTPKGKEILRLAIECKNQEALNIWDSLLQAENNAAMGELPVLVFKRNRTPAYVALNWKAFLGLLDKKATVEP